MIFWFFLFIFVLALSQGLLILEEETLIILATIFWVDLSGGFSKKFLEAELIEKSRLIENKFLYFYRLQIEILKLLICFHEFKNYFGNFLPRANRYILGRISYCLFTIFLVNRHLNLNMIALELLVTTSIDMFLKCLQKVDEGYSTNFKALEIFNFFYMDKLGKFKNEKYFRHEIGSLNFLL